MSHPAEFSDEDFALFQGLISRETGIHFSHGRKQQLRMAVDERLGKLRYRSYRDYYDFIQSPAGREEEMRHFIALITVGETSFFRNAPHFHALRNIVLPEIIARKKKSSKTIRVWSAGCSRGSEPYSLAIVLDQMLPAPEEWNVSIFATDINHHVLDLAREGIYMGRELAQVPEVYIEHYFHKNGRQYQLTDQIRKRVKFGYHNLAQSSFHLPELSHLDIIFCRNVTIYFDLQTTKRIVEQFYDCLDDGGYFFIGHSETLWQITDKYELIECPHAYIYRKTKEHKKAKSSGLPVNIPAMPSRYPASVAKARDQFSEKNAREETVPAPIQRPAKDLLAEAAALANDAKYEEAIRQLKKIVKEDSLCPGAYYLLGVLYYNAGSHDQAIEQFRKVIYIDSGAALSYFNLGNIYLQQKNPGKAKKEFENALRLLRKRRPEEILEFSDNFTVDYLLRACENNLAKIERLA